MLHNYDRLPHLPFGLYFFSHFIIFRNSFLGQIVMDIPCEIVRYSIHIKNLYRNVLKHKTVGESGKPPITRSMFEASF